MRILITGGAGFIGSHLAEHYQGIAEVRVLDSLRSGYLRNLEGLDVEFMQGDICDRDAVEKAVCDVDVIFHLAAMISVPESMHDPCGCNRINTLGLLNVLEAARDAGVGKLIFSSSAANYGDDPTVPKVETMAPAPKSPYAITKLDGEYYCRMAHDEGWLKTACLRYFNVYGPRQDPASQYAAAIPIFLAKALAGEPITIFGDGEQTRDFIYVKEVAAANAFMAAHTDLTGVYNVGYGNSISINGLAQKILELTDSTSEIKHGPVRAGDVKHSLAAIDKLLATGFRHVSDFDSGLETTVAYFRGLAGKS